MNKNVILVLAFLSSSNFSISQNIPIRSYMSTPKGNISTTHYHYINMPNGYLQTKLGSQSHDYKIILKNDSILAKYTRININDSIHSITIKKKKERRIVKPFETKFVKFTNARGELYIGIPKDTCWLFKIHSGRINAYSYLPEVDDIHIRAIQKGGEEIVPYTKAYVLKMVESNKEAMKYAEKGKLHEALCAYNGWNIR